MLPYVQVPVEPHLQVRVEWDQSERAGLVDTTPARALQIAVYKVGKPAAVQLWGLGWCNAVGWDGGGVGRPAALPCIGICHAYGTAQGQQPDFPTLRLARSATHAWQSCC